VKLVIAVVHGEDERALVESLTEREHRVTQLRSQGGFLKQSNATVMVGVEDAQVEDVLEIIRRTCRSRTEIFNPAPPPILSPGEFVLPMPVEVTFGGATVFVVDVERYERL